MFNGSVQCKVTSPTPHSVLRKHVPKSSPIQGLLVGAGEWLSPLFGILLQEIFVLLFLFSYLFRHLLMSVWTHVDLCYTPSHNTVLYSLLSRSILTVLAVESFFRLALASLWHAPLSVLTLSGYLFIFAPGSSCIFSDARNPGPRYWRIAFRNQDVGPGCDDAPGMLLLLALLADRGRTQVNAY